MSGIVFVKFVVFKFLTVVAFFATKRGRGIMRNMSNYRAQKSERFISVARRNEWEQQHAGTRTRKEGEEPIVVVGITKGIKEAENSDNFQKGTENTSSSVHGMGFFSMFLGSVRGYNGSGRKSFTSRKSRFYGNYYIKR